MRTTGQNRVIRGGSWNNNGRNCRSANRNRNTPDNRNQDNGFRLAAAPAGRGMDVPAPPEPVRIPSRWRKPPGKPQSAAGRG